MKIVFESELITQTVCQMKE